LAAADVEVEAGKLHQRLDAKVYIERLKEQKGFVVQFFCSNSAFHEILEVMFVCDGPFPRWFVEVRTAQHLFSTTSSRANWVTSAHQRRVSTTGPINLFFFKFSFCCFVHPPW